MLRLAVFTNSCSGTMSGDNSVKKRRLESKSKITNADTWGQKGSKDGQFSYPYGMAVGCDGTIYVADTNNNRIQHFDCNGNFLHKWGKKGTTDGDFNYPMGLAIGVFSEAKNGKSDEIMSEMRMIPELNAFPPGVLPICVSYLGVESIYVTDHFNNRIQVFGMDGKFLRKWGSKGRDDGQLGWPWGCAIGNDALSGSSVVYVSEVDNHRISVFDSNGKFIRKWGTQGSGDYQFDWPRGLCVSDGLVYIADGGNHRVVCYRTDGSGKVKLAPIFLEWPSALIVDDASNGVSVMYISDTRSHSIGQYLMDGSFVRQFGSKGNGDGQFLYPRGICKGVDPESGTSVLYVVDTGNSRIIKMNCNNIVWDE